VCLELLGPNPSRVHCHQTEQVLGPPLPPSLIAEEAISHQLFFVLLSDRPCAEDEALRERRRLVGERHSLPYIGYARERTSSCAPSTAATVPTQTKTFDFMVPTARRRLTRPLLLRDALLLLFRSERYQLRVPAGDEKSDD
jgi:hypothetical protein